jgi:hypothetical protein
MTFLWTFFGHYELRKEDTAFGHYELRKEDTAFFGLSGSKILFYIILYAVKFLKKYIEY